jgi:hypothetical protein
MTLARSCSRWWTMIAAALLISGCAGASRTSREPTHRPSATASGATAVASSPAELLSVPAVGRIFGRCAPGDRHWKIEFVPSNAATDSVTYRIDSARAHTVHAQPGGKALVWRLVPGRFHSHEPADPTSHSPAATLKTTAPVSLDITQATEPHIFRVNIRFAVAAAIGDTTHCALISASLNATTYYPGGQPPS